MVDRDLIQRLHDKGIIDKRNVLWWQLGFEGRRIFSEQEFNEGLETKTVKVMGWDPVAYEHIVEGEEMALQFWTRDDVPILLRNITFDNSLEIPGFITVKPLSHDGRQEEIVNLYRTYYPSVFHHPHIRGVAIEKTDKFLFWYPLSFGREPETYMTRGIYVKNEKMHCLINPISPAKFYKNIIINGWDHGMRPKTKAKEFAIEKNGYELVPYFEFDITKKHVMVYPVPIFEKKLDFPVFIKTIPKPPYVDVIGIGYAYPDFGGEVYYWDLPENKRKVVKQTLKKAFG